MEKISTEPTQSKPPLLTNAELAERINALIDLHGLAGLSLEQSFGVPAAQRVLRMMDNNLSELLDYYSELERAEAVSAPTPLAKPAPTVSTPAVSEIVNDKATLGELDELAEQARINAVQVRSLAAGINELTSVREDLQDFRRFTMVTNMMWLLEDLLEQQVGVLEDLRGVVSEHKAVRS